MCCSLLHFNRLLSFWIDIKFHIFRSADNSGPDWTTCRLNKDSNCGFGVSDPTVLPFVLQQQTPPQRLLSLPKIFFFFFCGRYPHFRHPSMYWPVCSLIIYWYAVATERERERERESEYINSFVEIRDRAQFCKTKFAKADIFAN